MPTSPNTSSTFRRARAILERGDTRAAIANLQETLAHNVAATDGAGPGDGWRLHLTMAHALEQEGRLEEAMVSSKRALHEAPEDQAAPWLSKGSLHAALGARMTALECFREAAKRGTNDYAARHLISALGGRDFSAPLHGEVIELFDRYADRFDEHLVSELGYSGHTVIPRAVAQIAGEALGGWDVMDLGCGTGLCGEGLRPMAGILVGVDVAPRMVEKAHQRGIYDLTYAADLVYALACRSTESVDLVTSADVLGYVGDLSAVHYEASRVLRIGGRLAFTVEAAADDDATYQMGPSRRCRYGRSYLLDLAARGEFDVEFLDAAALRREAGVDVVEFVVVLRKGPRG